MLPVLFIMDQGQNSGGQGGDNTPRSSARLDNKRKAADKAALRERRKRLRLPVVSPVAEAEGSDEDDAERDPDFAGGDAGSGDDHGDDNSGDDNEEDVGGGGSSQPAAGGGNAEAVAGGVMKRQTKASGIRCSPGKFLKLVKALSDEVKRDVTAKGFGGLLNFKPHQLSRKLISWLMRKLNPETMQLELGGGKVIAINEHAVWCTFQLPRGGSDPAPMDDKDARAVRDELGAMICGPSYRRGAGITLAVITDRLEKRLITGNLALRAFFMATFHCLLFSNTDTRIRLDDVMYTEDLDNMRNKNWCKAVVDKISVAGRLFRMDFAQKGENAPIHGCGIFLVMLYVDNLMHGLDTKPFCIPRCAFLDTKTIDAIAAMDRRGDVARGTRDYGNLRLKSISDTCYGVPPSALTLTGAAIGQGPDAVQLPPAAAAASVPPFAAGGSSGAGTSAAGASTSHDPGGYAPFNIQPPVFYEFPSFSTSFGQSIVDVVGRSRKCDALKVLKDFDASCTEAQMYAQKAAEYATMSRDLLAKAHHECFSSIQKLLVDAAADKRSTRERRRKANNDAASGAAGISSDVHGTQPEAGDAGAAPDMNENEPVPDMNENEPAAGDAEMGDDEHIVDTPSPIEVERAGGDAGAGDVHQTPPRDHRGDEDQGNPDTTPSALRGNFCSVDDVLQMFDSDGTSSDEPPPTSQRAPRNVVAKRAVSSVPRGGAQQNEGTKTYSRRSKDEADKNKAEMERKKAEMERKKAEEAERAEAEAKEKAEAEQADKLRVLAEQAEKDKAEEAKRERAEAEAKKKAADEQAEKARAEAEQAEKARAEAEQAEKLRAAAAQAEKEKAEEAEKLHAAAAQAEKEKAEEAERAEAEAKKKAADEEEAKAEAEKAKAEAEKAKAEAEKAKAEAEKAKAEVEAMKKAAADQKKADAEKKVQIAIQKQLNSNIDALSKPPPASKAKKALKMQLSKEYINQRDEYEKRLDMLRQVAHAEIDSLEKSIHGQAGSSSSADDVQFPAESDEDINNLSQPIRLSQEEASQGKADYSEFQRMIFKRLGDRLLKRPREYISPFKIARNRPEIPLAKAVALRRKIASDSELKRMTLLEFSLLVDLTGEEMLTSFGDDTQAESGIIDFCVHCMRHDDIVHKVASCGYRVFLTTGFYFNVSGCEAVLDQDKNETKAFGDVWRNLMAECEHYDLSKAKLIFVPIQDGAHFFVYCFNFIHKRVDVLDSNDYFIKCTDQEERHRVAFSKIPIIDAAFQKVSNLKLPRVGGWRRPFINVPKQAGPSDCLFFVWKYMEYYDGDSLTIDVNPFKGPIYRCEMMHYQMFHPLNQAELPESLDKFRIGGRPVPIEWDSSQSNN